MAIRSIVVAAAVVVVVVVVIVRSSNLVSSLNKPFIRPFIDIKIEPLGLGILHSAIFTLVVILSNPVFKSSDHLSLLINLIILDAISPTPFLLRCNLLLFRELLSMFG